MISRMISLIALLGCSCLFGMAGIAESDLVILDSVSPELIIIAPIFGSTWSAGSIQRIEWYAFDNHFAPHPIDIRCYIYGTGYANVGQNLPNTGFYYWEVPDYQTPNASIWITATDMFGNMYMTQSDAFEITEALPGAPEILSISVVNDTDILLSWSAVEHDILGNPCTPDGYRVYASNTPGVFDLIADTTQLVYLHQNAAIIWDKRFYMVKAYINRSQSPAELIPLEVSR